MHVCLNVNEIVRLIACELIESRNKATAVALACCRKSFEDPVLDALWETQEGLLPLLKSLPGDVWDEGRYTVSAPTTRFFSLPQPFGLKDFQKTPDDSGVGSFPQVCSKDAEARRILRSERPIFGSILGSAGLRHQQTFVSEYQNS